jgi:hypothetical protein
MITFGTSVADAVCPTRLCHAGGRGSSPVASVKYRQISIFRCRSGRNRPPLLFIRAGIPRADRPVIPARHLLSPALPASEAAGDVAGRPMEAGPAAGHLQPFRGTTRARTACNRALPLTRRGRNLLRRRDTRRRAGGRGHLRIEEYELEAGGLNQPARLTSHQLSAGTAASQKSSLRPVELFTSSWARNTSSDGSVGVPPWSTRISSRI